MVFFLLSSQHKDLKATRDMGIQIVFIAPKGMKETIKRTGHNNDHHVCSTSARGTNIGEEGGEATGAFTSS